MSTGQIITTIVGTGVAGYSGDGGPASAAQLNGPVRIIFDNAGNKYFSDEFNHVVRKVDAAGIITTIAGTGYGAGTGNGGYTGDGGPATAARLDKPTDLVFDNAGNLYIADFGNGVIRKVSTAGIITTYAGTGVNGYDGDGGPALSAKIADPLGLIFDAAGNFYFSNNGLWAVRKINPAGIISTIAGTGAMGYSGDGGPATAAKIKLTGMLAFDATGNLYVTDYYNYRIRKIDASGIITTVIGTGVSGNTGDGGPAINATIGQALGILIDPAGNIYLSDRAYPIIRKVNPAGIITTIAGNGIAGYSGDGGPASAAQFNNDVNCSAIDAFGNLYIADHSNNRIRRITYNSSGVDDIIPVLAHVLVYPNPASSTLTIGAEGAIKKITITDATGRQVFDDVFDSNKVAMNIASLATGAYFVKVNNVYAGKFIKE